MSAKTCFTCEHMRGSFRYGVCARTGAYPDLEMKYGGRCAGEGNGTPKMALWEPRRTIWMRLTRQQHKVAP